MAVTRSRLALGVAVVIAAAGAGAGLAATASDTPYAKRLQILEALAARYPGRVEPSQPLGKYGLWAGILVQTTWQRDSHRDRIPLWSLMNQHLSVEPTTYATELERARGVRDPQALCASSPSTSPAGVCEAWMRYLIGAKQGLPAPTLLRLLWRAHTTAIAYALGAQRQAFERVRTTTLERNFWGGWVEIVFLLDAAHFPTDAVTSVRASKLLMPPCSPLGTPGCQLRVADLGRAFPFVSALALRPASIDRAVREFATLRSNPLALTSLELADPSLGLALRLYLTVAR
jgi:hypothetical protein